MLKLRERLEGVLSCKDDARGNALEPPDVVLRYRARAEILKPMARCEFDLYLLLLHCRCYADIDRALPPAGIVSFYNSALSDRGNRMVPP
jgi:hypothetical protein